MPEAPPRTTSIAKLVLFAAVPAVLLVAAAEIAVRFTGAAERCPTSLNSPLWTCDPILHFKTRPSLTIHGTPLNALGMRGPEPLQGAAYHVLALGDSCTFGFRDSVGGEEPFVHDPYPQQLQELATARDGPGSLSVLNGGVAGYNTFHGIMLLRGRFRTVPADLITVRYGWNDLLGTGDRRPGMFHEPSSAIARGIEDLLLRTALYPYSKRLGLEIEHKLRGLAAPTPGVLPATWSPNNTVAEYEHNLRRIVELARRRGAGVWLVTSSNAFMTSDYRDPDAYGQTAAQQLGVLGFSGIHSFRELADIHARYNDATRRVAADVGVPLVDLEPVYRLHAGEPLFSAVDAIHPNDAGHTLEAETLYRKLVEVGVLGRGSGSFASPGGR
jgi:lysophospholipase L1-like esterase